MATNFHDHDVNYQENKIPEACQGWFTARNACDDKVLANISRKRI